VIDWARVSELHEEVGDDALEEVLELFASEVDEGLVRLRAATSPKALAAEFHFLKGAALNLGLDEIARLCALGESGAIAGAATESYRDAITRDFPECCRQLRAEWRARLAVP
jgi:HPt (histidine-containing phosphotransfer) domain-containing protein